MNKWLLIIANNNSDKAIIRPYLIIKRMSEPYEFICDKKHLQPGFFPRNFPILDSLVEQANSIYWPAHEVILQKDREDFKKLTPDEQHVIMNIQLFFSQSDGLVQQNIEKNFTNEITIREALDFMYTQNHVEMIHNKTYGNIINHLFQDNPALQLKIISAIENFPEIKKISQWFEKWFSSTEPIATKIFAQVPSEGVLFQGCFAILYWIRHYKQKLLPGVVKANELISRDETLHATFFSELYKMCTNRLTDEKAHEIMGEAVEYSSAFINNALKVSIIGINAKEMDEYIRFVADDWLVKCGHKKMFNATNPFQWLVMMGIESKTNFHEATSTGYNDKNDNSKRIITDDF